MSAPELPRVEARSLGEWRAWLAANHATSGTIWLVTWKQGRGPCLPYADARDEALCWGWVDSQARRLDDDRTRTRMSPRRPGSAWSAINRARVAELDTAGRLRPPGRRVIDAARDDGSWDALREADDPDRPPPDLAAALAGAEWSAVPRSSRRALLERIALARSSAARARRVDAAVAAARARA